MRWRVVATPIETEADIVAVRQRARLIAELIGFDRPYQTRIAAAISEVARYAFNEDVKAQAEFFVEREANCQLFVIRISSSAGNIADLQAILDGDVSPVGTAAGLLGAKRLMDRFNAAAGDEKETVIEVGQVIPSSVGPISKTKIAEITRSISSDRAEDPLAILREQNRELLQSLEEIRRRQEESEQLSRELGDTNRGVVALYAELDERAEQLRRASELKSRFLSNISHEFRTPLNSIMALSQLLLDHTDGDLNAEQEKQVGYIRHSARNLLELVNDLLDLAKVEAGKVELRPERFALPELFGALRGALKPLQFNKDVELIFEIDDEIPELFTDEAKVAQILRNLISNALKFTEEGEVRVSASYDLDMRFLTVSVRDTGIGIAPQHLDRIFEEFSQLETPLHGAVKGTGLGLPLSRNLAVLLGGEIRVESVLGQGSVFRLAVPAAIAGERKAAKARDRTRKQILIVDDDETFRYLFRHLIGGSSRFELIEAGSGEEGLRRAKEDRPDLIVLDLQMPHIDGFMVLQELKADPDTNAIPVLISTSLSITPELRAKLSPGISILSKDNLSRERVAACVSEMLEKDYAV